MLPNSADNGESGSKAASDSSSGSKAHAGHHGAIDFGKMTADIGSAGNMGTSIRGRRRKKVETSTWRSPGSLLRHHSPDTAPQTSAPPYSPSNNKLMVTTVWAEPKRKGCTRVPVVVSVRSSVSTPVRRRGDRRAYDRTGTIAERSERKIKLLNNKTVSKKRRGVGGEKVR